MKEFFTAAKAVVEDEKEEFVSFKLDGRELHAYPPTEGQLVFLFSAMGRGQSKTQRFASIVNIMMASLRADDQDYLEERLLSRDPKKRIGPDEVEKIFEHLAEEWFGRPTQPSSDSVSSEPNDGQK